MYHIIMTRYHDPSGQISLSQSVEPKYVIFDSENKPMSIKGNPIFEIEFYGKDNQSSPSYDGSTFRVGWDDAYIELIESKDSPCEDDPDYWK